MLQRIVVAIVTRALARPRVAAAVFVVAVGAALSGLPGLRVDFRFHAFIGSGDASYAALRDAVAVWGPDDGGLVVTATRTDGATWLEPAPLQALHEALVVVAARPEVRRVRGLPDAPTPPAPARPGEASVLETRPLRLTLAEAGATVEGVADVAARVRADPLLVPALLSADGGTTAALVELAIDTDDIAAAGPAVRAVRAVLAERFPEGSGVEVRVGGIPAVRADLVAAILHDQLLFTVLTVAVMAGLLLLLFRSRAGLLVPMVLAVIPSVVLLGVMGHLGEPIGLLTQVLPTFIPVVAVADAIHLLSRFFDEARPHADAQGRITPEQARDVAARAYAHVGVACFSTSFTTAVGFLSLALSDMAVLRTFGALAAVGVTVAYVVFLVAGPLTLAAVRRVPPLRPVDARGTRALGWLAGVTVRRARVIVAVATLLFVMTGFFAARVTTNDRLQDGLPADSAAVAANDHIDATLGGVLTVTLDLRGPPGVFDDVAVLAILADVEDRLARTPPIRSVLGPGRLARLLNERVTGTARVPDDPELLAQLRLLAGDDPARAAGLVIADGSAARIQFTTPDVGSTVLLRVVDDVAARAQAALGAKGIDVRATGTVVAAQRGFARLTGSLVTSLLAALVVIGAFVLLLFRDLRLALVALPVNVLPLVMCLGVMGALGWALNPTAGVVFCIAIGIAVDDTLHLIVRLREEQRGGADGADLEGALGRALTGTGRALVLTSVILGLGFLLNALSSFPINRTLGVLGSSTIATALIADLVLLPALLALTSPRRGRGPSTTTTKET